MKSKKKSTKKVSKKAEKIAIHLFSLRRSGTHLIANFIEKATSTHLYNNFYLGNIKDADKRVINTDRSLFVYEDQSPVALMNELVSNSMYKDILGEYDKHIAVINMRDPVNLWASRTKHWHLLSSEGKHIDKGMVFGLTGTYLNMFIEDIKLPHPSFKNNYNQFVDTKEGRKELHDFLSKYTDTIPFKECESVIDVVPVDGGGSSFTGREKRDNYHNGYLYYRDAVAFRNLIDDGIVKVSKDLFEVEINWDEENG